MSEENTKTAKATAPGKVILFGEHAVVYDKLGIATSIDKRAYAYVQPSEDNKVTIIVEKYNLQKSMTEEELFELYDLVERLKRDKKFDEIKYLQSKDNLSAPFFVVSVFMKKHGFKPIKITGRSDVEKNLGSGSSAFSSMVMAISKYYGVELTKKEISDLAYEGDIVAHGGTPSGIDNAIVTYGGYIQYRKTKGIETLDIDFELPLVFVESGEPATTADTVPYIRKKKEYSKVFVDEVMDNLDRIAMESLESLKERDLKRLGELMLKYYKELRKLDISTKKLDEIVEIAQDNDALGAKPTGGWGGGCCIVLAKDEEQASKLVEIYKKKGFSCFQTKTGVEGVKGIE